EPLENHPELAVACALKMQIAMKEINTLNEADGLPQLEMGIAVNTGEVVVGNIGSEKRAKYGAVGSQVNFTGRAESFTVGGQLLVSRVTYERLSDKLDIRNTLELEMKGVRGKVTLYDVRGITGRFEAHLEDRDETMIRLRAGLEVEVFGIEKKIMQDTGKDAFITHLSLRSARMTLNDSLAQWEDVRMIPKRESDDSPDAEIYAKVTSVQNSGQGWEAEVRFTSVSSAAYKMFRRLMDAAH
ncbi:MAG: adenylate/guanylate cyclase domain-containing protein, partial [Pseudomonadota bacterium]